MPNPTANINLTTNDRQDFYDLATECEKAQRAGCDQQCRQCPFNIELYANDLKQATMIKTIAALDYVKETEYAEQKMYTGIGFCIIFGIVIAAVFACVH